MIDSLPMLIITKKQSDSSPLSVKDTLSLTAEERSKTRYRCESDQGVSLLLRLPRGTILEEGDILQAETEELIKVIAKSEPVLTVTTPDPVLFLKTVYHLGNRHVPLEITADYLRLSPDSVLQEMLVHLGVTITEESCPFHPEKGAYHHH